MLYDLTASLDGNSFPVVENGTTVVQSTASKGKSTAFSITGKAPNAQQVTIIVNGSSKTYAVNTTNNNSFAASPITLQKGKNSVNIKVINGTQVVQTTRDIAFYNGSVTFYDVNINEFSGASTTLLQSSALEYSPNFVYKSTSNKLTITGKVIVPNSYYEVVTDPGPPEVKNFLPHPDPTATSGPKSFQSSFKASLKLVTNSVYTNFKNSIIVTLR